MEPMLVREPEARKLLGGISRTKLWELAVRDRQIESITIGSARLFPVDALRRFVDERRLAVNESAANDPTAV